MFPWYYIYGGHGLVPNFWLWALPGRTPLGRRARPQGHASLAPPRPSPVTPGAGARHTIFSGPTHSPTCVNPLYY